MSLALLHAPADVLRWLLIAKLAAGDPRTAPLPAWPCYNDAEPSGPDNCLTTYDEQPQDDGRAMVDGEGFLHHGVQIRVRSSLPGTGRAKAEALRLVMTEGVHRELITVTYQGTATYLVQCLAKVSGVLRLGAESPTSKRCLYTINALMSLTRTA